MVVSGPWLIDKSALARIRRSSDAETWVTRVNRGLLRVTTLTLLEVGFSAQSGGDWHTSMDRPPIASMPVETLTPRAEARAVQVQGLLAERGQHRAPSVPDLLIAAAAEVGGLTLLHLNRDFDLVAAVTGQAVERLHT